MSESWMKKHARNLLTTNPVDDTGSALLNKNKLSGSERKLKAKGINISDPKEKDKFKAYKASGGSLTHTQAATIGYKTPQQSKAVIAEKKSIEDAKSKAIRKKAEQKGLGKKPFAGASAKIYD
jgi:hypothetical protein